MFTEEQATVAGTHHSVSGAYNNPSRCAATSRSSSAAAASEDAADGRPVRRRLQLFGDPERARHLLGVLRGHCENVGRDPAEITKTSMMTLVIAETEDGVRPELEAMRDAGFPEERIACTTAGTPEQILERAHAFRDVGIEGVTSRCPTCTTPRRWRSPGPRARRVRPGQPGARPVDAEDARRRFAEGPRRATRDGGRPTVRPHLVPIAFALPG